MQVKHLTIVLLLLKKKVPQLLVHKGFHIRVQVKPIQRLEVDEVPHVLEVGDSCQEGRGLGPPMLQGSVGHQNNLVGPKAVEGRAEQVEASILPETPLVKQDLQTHEVGCNLFLDGVVGAKNVFQECISEWKCLRRDIFIPPQFHLVVWIE